VKDLAIKDVAQRTGLAAGTIRMWEQRYGFPEPERTSGGYRLYSVEDVEVLRRVLAYRERGLSVGAALERARAWDGPTDCPSIYGAIATSGQPLRPQLLRKQTLIAISAAIEDETLARAAGPIVIGAFQQERNYRAVQHRYRRLAARADVVLVFADFDAVSGGDGEPIEVPIGSDDALGNEWAVVIDAPGYSACLLAWEPPRPENALPVPDRMRRFEAVWTLDPDVVRRAAMVGGALAGRADAELGARVEGLLADRPLALEQPAPALTALTNRIVGYLEG
jgi:MerR family transcriptional regulator, light-induced transcriptional regulator